MKRLWRRARRRPAEAAAWALALSACCWVILTPLLVARYPMMTDLPFHAANAAVIKHYWDPAFHFREQFVLQPFAVPYMSMYLIAALLMTVMSAVSAMKVAAAVMLALLPAGLAVLFYGMRKSPLLGLSGLLLVWSGLTSWGFLNFMGALGLFAMVVGVTLRLLDRPRRGLGWLLCGLLLVVFFTHPFRFPFAVCAVIGCAVVMYPATRRYRPAVGPLLLPLALFGSWWWSRPAALAGDFGPLALHRERLRQAGHFLFRSLRGKAESVAYDQAITIMGYLVVGLVVLFVLQARWRHRRAKDWAWVTGAAVVVASCALVFLGLYLVLPMQIGLWWYVFPREITSALFVALALLPDLPRQGWLKLLAVAVFCAAMLPITKLVIDSYRAFDRATVDFAAISKRIPQAPKLLYLIFDHHGAPAINTPFIHLPAYVQAEKGGWLSFHFATWGASPVIYRPRSEPGAVVPPATPLRWEWMPRRFQVRRHGHFFNWFLVRQRHNPSSRFRADPSIKLVAHEGSWWLLRRRR